MPKNVTVWLASRYLTSSSFTNLRTLVKPVARSFNKQRLSLIRRSFEGKHLRLVMLQVCFFVTCHFLLSSLQTECENVHVCTSPFCIMKPKALLPAKATAARQPDDGAGVTRKWTERVGMMKDTNALFCQCAQWLCFRILRLLTSAQSAPVLQLFSSAKGHYCSDVLFLFYACSYFRRRLLSLHVTDTKRRLGAVDGIFLFNANQLWPCVVQAQAYDISLSWRVWSLRVMFVGLLMRAHLAVLGWSKCNI